MSVSRRKFIRAATLAGAGLALAPAAEAASKQVLVHHVFFWLKNPASTEDLNKLIEGISSLKAIKEIKSLRIGLPANTPARDVIDASYSVSLLTFFDGVKSHDAYQIHPIHEKFVATYAPLWQKVVVYDSMDIG